MSDWWRQSTSTNVEVEPAANTSPAPAPSPMPLPAGTPVGPASALGATSASLPVRAPNVTVTAGGLLEADSHIRVLTPTEIMRTMPRLAPAPPAHPAHTPPATPAPAAPAATTRDTSWQCMFAL
ncbi:unnamed protein product [Leptidea sinapis]|uniref:Uncharacterized protein n=1 Tax=Leptidea sinapis TaxID=189913 RepID=A0A5E4QR00_9NEOP|nr:unnamed protein product [Leptidea sinapis]